jgi:hypothetical protein
MPRKLLNVSHEILPVLHVIPVLVATLLWQQGQPLWRDAQCLLAKSEKRCLSFLTDMRLSLQEYGSRLA